MKKKLTVPGNLVGSKEKYLQERDQLLETISAQLEAGPDRTFTEFY
jgi:hypothetical protein